MLLETLAVKLQGDVSDFVAKMNTAASAVTAVGDKMQATGQRMQSMGQQWSLYISAPLIAMGKASLDSAKDFEQSMNVMQQVSSATTEQMSMLSKQAIQTGKDSVFSAGEVAKSQLALAKAGFEVNQIMDATPGVVNLAAAADMDLAMAADVTASAVNAFRLEASAATRISDLLAAAANNSTAEVHDMALALKMSSAVMAQYGFTAEETVTILAQMANAGIKNSDAGTALKVAMMRLAAPTQAAADEMYKYGIRIYDANGAMKSAREIIEEFTTKLGPNATAMRVVTNVTKEMEKAYDKARDQVEPLTRKIYEQRDALHIMQQELTATIAKYGEGSIEVQKKELAIEKLSNKLKDTEDAYSKATGAVIQYEKSSAAAYTVTEALTEAQRNAALETILGTDGIRVMNVLMAEGIEKHDQMAAAVTEQGMAQDVASARMKGLAGAIEYFKGTLDSLMIETALPWLNTLGDLIRGTADWIAKFGELDPALQKNIVIFAAMAAAIGPVLIYSGLLISSLGSLISLFGALLNPINLVIVGLGALAIAAGLQNGASLHLNALIDTVKNVSRYFLELLRDGNVLNQWLEQLPAPIQPVVEAFGRVIAIVRDVGAGFAKELPAMIGAVMDLGRTVGTEIPRILGHFNDLWATLSGGRNGQAIGSFLGKFITTALKGVGTILTQIRAVMDAFDILVRATGAILSGDFAGYWALKDEWNKAWADFGGATADQWKQFQSIWENNMQEVPAPTGPYLGTQAGGGGAGGVTIQLSQTFTGNVDKNTVASATQQGIMQGLRQVGLA